MLYHFNAFIVSVVVLFGGLFEVERAKRIERQLKHIEAALRRLPGHLTRTSSSSLCVKRSEPADRRAQRDTGSARAIQFAALTYVVDKSMAPGVMR